MKKTILITGANRGIGLEFVRQYSNKNTHIIATVRNHQDIDELTNLSKEYSIDINCLDLEDKQQINQFTNKLANKTIDIFINNAAYYGPKGLKLGEIDEQEWQRVFYINSIAPLLLAQALTHNIKLGRDKKLIFISSKMASISDNQSGGSYLYRSSKAALNSVVKSLAIDLKKHGIKTLCLHPGWVKTRMGGPNALISSSESVDKMRKVIENLTNSQSGQFINFDGKPISW
jgi:NAD(P)-dependent dehydrogenase (short-subunit alcohol dehydrogenase family)